MNAFIVVLIITGVCGSSFILWWTSAGMLLLVFFWLVFMVFVVSYLVAVCYSAWLLPMSNSLYPISILEEDSMSQQSLLSSSQSDGCSLHFAPA